jgi:hypothetical protein
MISWVYTRRSGAGNSPAGFMTMLATSNLVMNYRSKHGQVVKDNLAMFFARTSSAFQRVAYIQVCGLMDMFSCLFENMFIC